MRATHGTVPYALTDHFSFAMQNEWRKEGITVQKVTYRGSALIFLAFMGSDNPFINVSIVNNDYYLDYEFKPNHEIHVITPRTEELAVIRVDRSSQSFYWLMKMSVFTPPPPPRNRSLGQGNVLLTSVILSTRVGGLCMMSLPVWLPGPMFL